jgi:hypothetical protein
VAALAHALECLTTDALLRRALARRAARHVRETYGLDRQTRELEAIYRGAASRR